MITLLRAWSAGGGTVLDRLLPNLYEQLRERPGNTLQATALPLDELALISSARGAYFVALDDALKRLLK